jgi:mercuric ion transport protein
MGGQSRTTVLGIIGAALAVLLCCGGPLLFAAISAAGLTAWLSNSVYVLIAAALIAVGSAVLCLRHRRIDAQDCCTADALNKASKHE